MSVIRLFNPSVLAGSTSAVITIPEDGFIEAITLGVGLLANTGGAADGDGCTGEVSFNGQETTTSHDVRGSLCTAAVFHADTILQGVMSGNHNNPLCVITPISVPVQAGERIFLHMVQLGVGLYAGVAYLFIRDGRAARTRRRVR